jgi:hypothetical protein
MRFTIHTLVDITETLARRGEDAKLFRQQQNFLTVIQTIGLRVNPEYIGPPKIITDIPTKHNLGSKYTTKQSIWKYSFDMEYEGALDVETLVNDFDLIPIITELDETAHFDNAHFLTKDIAKCNIFFSIDDK